MSLSVDSICPLCHESYTPIGDDPHQVCGVCDDLLKHESNCCGARIINEYECDDGTIIGHCSDCKEGCTNTLITDVIK